MALVAVAEDLTGAAVTGDNHEAAIVLDIKEIEVLVGVPRRTPAKVTRLGRTDDVLPLKETLCFLQSLLFADRLGTDATAQN